MTDRLIVISGGKVAVVDEEDYFHLAHLNWYFSMGYAQRQVQKDYARSTITMHDVVAQRMGHDLAGLEVDHKDRDGLNNRRNNLLVGTHSQNMQNRGVQKNNTTGHRGVQWYKKTQKWRVSIQHEGANIHIGYFFELSRAIHARKAAELIYFGRNIED